MAIRCARSRTFVSSWEILTVRRNMRRISTKIMNRKIKLTGVWVPDRSDIQYTISYLLKQGASVAEVPVVMDERTKGVSYLTPVNAARYMIQMLVSILFIQNFRK